MNTKGKKTVFRLGSAPGGASIANVLQFISGLPVDKPWQVTIEPYKKSRSGAQNRLLWRWNTEIGDYLGYTKEEMHEILKEQMAVPIFTRDDESYARMVKAVKDVRRSGMCNTADDLKKKIVELTSTANFNTAQMTEYLGGIELFAAEHGAPITFPRDLMMDALGRE